MSKIIHDSGGFALPSCVIGPKNHHLNLLDSKLKPILTCSLTFARVSRSLPVFSSGFEWLMMMSISTLIGWCYCFDSGLLNPKWKLLWHVNSYLQTKSQSHNTLRLLTYINILINNAYKGSSLHQVAYQRPHSWKLEKKNMWRFNYSCLDLPYKIQMQHLTFFHQVVLKSALTSSCGVVPDNDKSLSGTSSSPNCSIWPNIGNFSSKVLSPCSSPLWSAKSESSLMLSRSPRSKCTSAASQLICNWESSS